MKSECRECITHCFPDDPRQITRDMLHKQRYPHAYPKYHRPLCESCPAHEEPQAILEYTNKDYEDRMDGLEQMVKHIHEHRYYGNLRKKRTSKYA